MPASARPIESHTVYRCTVDMVAKVIGKDEFAIGFIETETAHTFTVGVTPQDAAELVEALTLMLRERGGNN
jgi:hypothetical protein